MCVLGVLWVWVEL